MKILRPEVKETLEFIGGFDNLIDVTIKGCYNITDEEIEEIEFFATKEELSLFTDVISGLIQPSFTQIRQALNIRNKYVAYFQGL